MPHAITTFLDTFHRLDARNLLDILLIAAVIYWLLLWLRGTSAMSLLRGVVIVVAAGAALGGIFNLTVVNWLLRNSLTALLVAIPIIFQPEIRRALERVGRTGMHSWRGRSGAASVHEVVTRGAQELSSIRHGALIVLEGETGLEDYVATGVRIDALPSVPLLLSIFFVNSALHDGAIIIREGRVAAAGCTLPLAEAVASAGHVGTRHRAALGISERTDALAVVVSEETGDISLATNGRLLSGLEPHRLTALLSSMAEPAASRRRTDPAQIEAVTAREDLAGDQATIGL